MNQTIEDGISNLAKEPQEFIEENCLCTPQNSPKAKCARRPPKAINDDFYRTYYEWVSNPKFTIKQACQRVNLAQGTFYLKLQELGLKKKTEVKASVEFNKTLKQIRDEELVLVRQMSCRQALSVVKRAIEVTDLIPKWANQVEVFNETVCVHILLKLGKQFWQGKATKAICKELGINEKTYYNHLHRGSFAFYCSLVLEQIQFKG